MFYVRCEERSPGPGLEISEILVNQSCHQNNQVAGSLVHGGKGPSRPPWLGAHSLDDMG